MRTDGGCTFCEKSESTSQESTKKEEATPDEEAKTAKHARKIAQIKKGYIGRCSQEEALEVLKTNPKFTDKDGSQVIFNYNHLISHYGYGRRRKHNTPDKQRLELLPTAIQAIKHANYTIKYPENVFPDYINGHILKGSQRVYVYNLSKNKKFYVYAYHDSGVITGWYIKKRPTGSIARAVGQRYVNYTYQKKRIPVGRIPSHMTFVLVAQTSPTSHNQSCSYLTKLSHQKSTQKEFYETKTIAILPF